MQTPKPEPGRPSSVARRQASAGDAVPAEPSDLANALPPPDTANSPTVISLNKPLSADSTLTEQLRGRQLGHFELIEPIGRGGMAAVIRAKDLQLGRTVALKILPPEMAVDPENISRFKSEARAAAKLDHENIARVFYCGEDQGLHFIAFEYVEGTDLRAMFSQNGPLSPAQAVKFMLQIATGLAHAAERGVVHRDIKPSNIIITPEGRAKIVDMGLARHVDAIGGVTQSGMTLGTFDYISPEQAIEPRSADIRSDIYSLGCTFYHLLTGEPPVPEGTAAKKLHHHQQVDPIDPRDLNPNIPDELAAILARMMAKDPRLRYQRPEQLVQHLIHVAQKLHMHETGSAETVLFMDAPLPRPPRFSPWIAMALAASAVALIAAVAGVVSSSRDPGPRTLPWDNPDANSKTAGPAAHNGTAGRDSKSDVHPTPPLPEPRNAATTQELVRLLEQKTEHIRLTGSTYDLSELFSDSPERRIGFRVTQRRLKIEGVAGSRPPVLRWSAGRRNGRDSEPLAVFELSATDQEMVAEFIHVRFEGHASEDDAPTIAVSARGVKQLDFRKCEFSLERPADSRAGGAIRFEEHSEKPSVLVLNECLFSRGPCAVEMTDRAQLKATQCAFGPHDTVFRIRPIAVRTMPNLTWEMMNLQHCTFMVRSGAVIQLEKGATGTMRAGWCLFGRVLDPSDTEDAVLVRQLEFKDKDSVVFAGLENEANSRNTYHNLVIWEAGSQRAVRAAEARKQFGFDDAGAVELVQRPWQESNPLQWLEDDPPKAFALLTNIAALRTRPRLQRMIGVQRGPWGELYKTAALTALNEEPAEMQFTRRYVNPLVPAEMPLPPQTYRSLESAVGEAKPGDTVFLQANGPIEIHPIRWSRTDERALIVRPDEGYKPVLVLHGDVAEATPALFTVGGGKIEFRDLHFRLHSDPKKEREKLAAITLTGAGQAAFTRCVFTLDESEGCQNDVVWIIGENDAASRSADRRPRVRFDGCFIRGKGDMLDVRPSRRFDLEMENSLLALDGTMIAVHANPKEVPAVASSISLQRVTGFVTDYWLDLRLPEEDRKAGGGLAVTQCKVDRCLLISGAGKALVHGVGIDSETMQRQYLVWEGRGNVYANFVQMVDVELPASAMMMPTMPVSPKAWRTFTREGEDSFMDVKLLRPPTSDRPLARMLPEDFRVKLLDMKKMEAPGDTGANLSDLPTVEEP